MKTSRYSFQYERTISHWFIHFSPYPPRKRLIIIINSNIVHQIDVFEDKEIHNCGNVEENNDLAECTAESGRSHTLVVYFSFHNYTEKERNLLNKAHTLTHLFIFILIICFRHSKKRTNACAFVRNYNNFCIDFYRVRVTLFSQAVEATQR